MKAMIVYDSGFGNTAKIAQAIGDGVRAALGSVGDVDVYPVADVKAQQLAGVDLLVVGSPTRGFRPMPTTTEFLKGIPNNSLRGVRVAAFDTRFTAEKIRAIGWFLNALVGLFGYAARSISDQLVKKGGTLALLPEGFYVGDTEGPLLEGEAERATIWARRLVTETVPA